MPNAQKMLQVLNGNPVWPPPMWLMRQAGRYLPEYRAVRAEAGGFLELVYNPALATEITLQPIRRFGFDAAILFSDILVIPDALGQAVRFEAGEGPRLDPISSVADLTVSPADVISYKLQPVIETVSMLRAALPRETSLIGFCGAPWTVATYMIAGRGTEDQGPAKEWAYSNPAKLDALMDVLIEASIVYLAAQVKAGAGILQIFDTWAGSLDDLGFQRFVIEPTRKIIEGVKARVGDVPIIGFPKGVGTRAQNYIKGTGINAIGLDWTADIAGVSRDSKIAVQGNLDPMRLMMGNAAIEAGVDDLFSKMKDRPFIFNLGHGIGQFTPVEAVETLVARVRRG